jgi:hypothetical protein
MKRNHLGGSIRRHQGGEASPGEPSGHTKLGLEEDLLRDLSRRQEPYYGLRVERAWFGGGQGS